MESSFEGPLAHARYIAEERALDITFDSGRVYRYSDVPMAVFKWLEAADSPISFFNRKIRDEYDWADITPAPEQPDLTTQLLCTLHAVQNDAQTGS